MQVNAYLSFEGRAEEAIEFYKKALGAEVTVLMRFGEAPDQPPPGVMPPGSEKKIMHSSLRIGDTEVMATDGRVSGKTNFDGISLALTNVSIAEAEKSFAALSDGGEVQMPLQQTFFAKRFGMLADRFGVTWMVASTA